MHITYVFCTRYYTKIVAYGVTASTPASKRGSIGSNPVAQRELLKSVLQYTRQLDSQALVGNMIAVMLLNAQVFKIGCAERSKAADC